MSIDFQRTFGRGNNAGNVSTQNNNEDRPKAELWLNIGYTVEVAVQNGEETVNETRFVSLPTGIPLDTMELLSTRSTNEGFRAFQSARNDLHSQIMAAAEALGPGEEKILNLEIQLRRVNGEVEAVSTENNPFAKPLQL